MPNGKVWHRDWQNVNGTLQRLEIPGGWLVRSTTMVLQGASKVYASESLIKIDDPEHHWHLEQTPG